MDDTKKQINLRLYKPIMEMLEKEDGFLVSSGGLATSKLLDINLNQKIKVKVFANMTGEYISGDWSEFAIYVTEKEDSFSDNKAGIALIGSRDHVAQFSGENENVRDSFNFEWFSVENTGETVIFEDSSGRSFSEDKDTDKPSSEKVFGGLDPNKEWVIRINSHVKGKGHTSIIFNKINIEYP